MSWDDMGTIFVETLIGVAPEPIQYIPRADSGRPSRTIDYAIVERRPVAPVDPMDGSLAPMISVAVKNNALTGIWTGEIDTGGDTISLPVRVGEDPRALTIARIIEHDAGIVKLELR